MRGELAPPSVPRSRTRGERFDDLVLDAVEELEHRWSAELTDVEFAVEEVPAVPEGDGDFDPEVVVDRGVPLGRLLRSGLIGVSGDPAPTIVVYRRPVEARASAGEDRSDLIFLVVAELVAELLGIDVDDIDPTPE